MNGYPQLCKLKTKEGELGKLKYQAEKHEYEIILKNFKVND